MAPASPAGLHNGGARSFSRIDGEPKLELMTYHLPNLLDPM